MSLEHDSKKKSSSCSEERNRNTFKDDINIHINMDINMDMNMDINMDINMDMEAQVLMEIFQTLSHPCPTLEMMKYVLQQEYDSSYSSSSSSYWKRQQWQSQELSLPTNHISNSKDFTFVNWKERKTTLNFPRDVVILMGEENVGGEGAHSSFRTNYSNHQDDDVLTPPPPHDDDSIYHSKQSSIPPWTSRIHHTLFWMPSEEQFLLKMSLPFQITFLKIIMALLENKDPWDDCYYYYNHDSYDSIHYPSTTTNTTTTKSRPSKSVPTTINNTHPNTGKRYKTIILPTEDEISQYTLYSVIRLRCCSGNLYHSNPIHHDHHYRDEYHIPTDIVDAVWIMMTTTLQQLQVRLDYSKDSQHEPSQTETTTNLEMIQDPFCKDIQYLLTLQCRFLGILSSAGMTPQQLQRIVDWITTSTSCYSNRNHSHGNRNRNSNNHNHTTAIKNTVSLSVKTPLPNNELVRHRIQRIHQHVKIQLLQAIIRATNISSFTKKLKGKASPRDLFCFGSSSSSTTRSGIIHNIDPKLYPITSKIHQGWPWTHSFGMACWFRWEGAGNHTSTIMTILKIQSEDGTCFDISLKPLDDQNPSIAIIVYTVHDSLNRKMKSASSILRSGPGTIGSSVRTYELKSCPILPNVWFHLALRHLKKSYLSLQKDELTIWIDGKIMTKEVLKFPLYNSCSTGANTSNSTNVVNASLIKDGIFPSMSTDQQHASSSSSSSISIEFCRGLNAETGSLFVFHGVISDETFKSLYEYTSGTTDSSHSSLSSLEIQISSSFHTANILKDADRDEIVIARKRTSSNSNVGPKYTFPSETKAIDLIGDDDLSVLSDIHHPVRGEFSRSAFITHLLFVWDASRLSEDGYILEAHSKIHCRLDHPYSSIWRMRYLNDTIRSIGGVQILLCMIKSLLDSGNGIGGSWNDYEDEWSSGGVLPLCIILVSSFLRDSDTNRREFLRCGGPEILENLILENKRQYLLDLSKIKADSHWIGTNAYRWNPFVAEMLMKALIDLDHSCSYDHMLWSKMSSRIIWNLYLWFGGLGDTPGIALHAIFLPCLSSSVKSDPTSFSDYIDVSGIVNFIREISVISSPTDVPNHFYFDDLSRKTSLSPSERNHVVDISLGILYSLLSVRVTKTQLLPILEFISFYAEMNQNAKPSSSTGRDDGSTSRERKVQLLLAIQKMTAMLALLLNTRPVILGLFDCLNEILGEDASWFLCCLVNSHDDEIRCSGIHCLTALYDFLQFEKSGDIDQSSLTKQFLDARQKAVTTFKSAGAGWGGARRGFDASEKAIDIGYKLLWHILKSHRHDLSNYSYNAMKHSLFRNSQGTLTSYLDIAVMKNEVLGHGFLFHNVLMSTLNREVQIESNSMFRNTSATSVILDFSLRYLPKDEQEMWLFDFLTLIRVSPSCKKQFETTTDWHHSLFYVASDIVEELCAHNINKLGHGKESMNLNVQDESVERKIFSRFDLVFQLYATLIGHCIRNDDLSISTIDLAAALQRVAVNGSIVFSILLSYVLADLIQNGTLIGKNGQLRERNIQTSAKEFSQMELSRAARHWKTIRHITSISLGLVTSNGFSLSDLFDYKNNLSSILDQPSGGLFGIHLDNDKVAGISAAQIIGLSRTTLQKDGSNAAHHLERDMMRRVSTLISSQIMDLLDPFIFPSYSLEIESSAANTYAISALVNSLDSRIADSNETLLYSLVRLALLNIAYLEPGSSKFLKACHLIRCYHQLTLDVKIGNEVAGQETARANAIAVVDRLAVCILLLCHKSLFKCFTVLNELDCNSNSGIWSTFDTSKHIRRLRKCVEVIGDTVQDVYIARYSFLNLALSKESISSLRECMEFWVDSKQSPQDMRSNLILQTEWVQKFHDIDYVKENERDLFLVIPEHLKVSENISNDGVESDYGFMIMKQLLDESLSISREFISVLNEPFQNYLNLRVKWTNSSAVRDLEYNGNLLTSSLSRQYQDRLKDSICTDMKHSTFAQRRLLYIERKMEKGLNPIRWKLARNPDMMLRRILLVENKNFDSHFDARYDLGIGSVNEVKQGQDLLKLIQSAKAGIVKVGGNIPSDPQDKVEDEANLDDSTSEPSIKEDKDHDYLISDWEKIESSEATADKGDRKGPFDWVYEFIWSPKEKFICFFDNIQIVTVDAVIEGELVLSTHNIYFKSTDDPISSITKSRVDQNVFDGILDDGRWRLNRLSKIYGRRFMLRAQAIELFFADAHELFLNFCKGPKERSKFVDRLGRCQTPLLPAIPKSLNPQSVFQNSFKSTIDAWRERKMSNFEYLMQLNIIAGRSFNDVSQYPVFPWVIADYESDDLDLENPSTYRDLSKPIGALNSDRLLQLIDRYHDLDGLPEEEKFLYGSHYSSPGVVLHYLLRQEPFTSMAIALQSGRFDCPDRLFYNIGACWKSCLTSTSDVKELIPEFFTCPEIFLNTNNFPLGATQSQNTISDVILPPWAKGSAYEFVRLNRLALESEYVSSTLHHWIDLIFGFKQRGPEAIRANNVFHFLSYEGSVNLDKITNELDRAATESQIQNFGQTPSQLIASEPHPCRFSAAECWKPLISEVSTVKRLTCYTPVKQFGGSRSKGVHGPVISIQVLSDHVAAIYADWSVGIYKWSPAAHGKTPFYLRMDKMRPIVTKEMSKSSFAMGVNHENLTNAPSSRKKSCIGHWTFAMSTATAAQTSKLSRSIGTSKTKTISSSLEATLISCGYCDETLKAHTLDGLRLKCSEDGGHMGPINCISIGEDGILLISGGDDCTCRVWTVEDSNMASALIDSYTLTAQGYTQSSALTCCLVLWGHVRPIISLACSVALDIVVSGSDDGRICIHTIRRGKFIRSIYPDDEIHPSCAVRHLTLHSDGKFVAQMDSGWLYMFTINGVKLATVDAGEILNVISMVPGGGDSLVTGGEKGKVKIRSLVDLSIQYVLDLSDYGTIQCVAFTPQPPIGSKSIQQFLFVGTSDGSITVVCADSDSNHDEATTQK